MHAVAVVCGGRSVGGGSDEWVCEFDAPIEVEQPGVDRRADRGDVDAEDRGGTVEQYGVAEGLCGRGEDEQLGIGGQLDETSDVALFDLAGRRVRSEERRVGKEWRWRRGRGLY